MYVFTTDSRFNIFSRNGSDYGVFHEFLLMFFKHAVKSSRVISKKLSRDCSSVRPKFWVLILFVQISVCTGQLQQYYSLGGCSIILCKNIRGYVFEIKPVVCITV